MIDSTISRRIDMLRTIMIFGVVVLHTPLYVPITETGSDPFSLIKAFFQQGFFRASVPVLTAISGYLLFQAALDKDPIKLWKKKGRAILVPFLVFNLGLLGVMWAGGMPLPDNLIDAAFGLTNSPVNYPLNFLRDMIVLMVLAPGMGMFLDRSRFWAWVGLLYLIVVFMWDIDGKLILRNDMPIIFYLGGMAARKGWNVKALDFNAIPGLALFCSLCAAWVSLEIANNNPLRFAAPLLLWPAASLLDNTKIGGWLVKMSRYSFFVFLAHAPILAASWIVYQKFQIVPYPIYWIAAPAFTIALLVALYKAMMRWMPGLFSLMIGCKVPKKTTVLAVNIAHH